MSNGKNYFPTQTIRTKHRLFSFAGIHEPNIAVLCSFGSPEGLVILHMMQDAGFEFRVCTIDTGRLPEETHDLISTWEKRINTPIDMIYPISGTLGPLVKKIGGTNGFRDSVANRELCCHTRKVAPLNKYYADMQISATISGLRQGQSEERQNIEFASLDKYTGRVMIYPLHDWTSIDVHKYILEHSLPINALHDEGYTSVGCAPCSRPGSGREGRWWWEGKDTPKECGIHTQGDGI